MVAATISTLPAPGMFAALRRGGGSRSTGDEEEQNAEETQGSGQGFRFHEVGVGRPDCGSGSFSWQRRGGDFAVGLWTLSG